MPEVFRPADEFSYRRPPVFSRWTQPNNALKNGGALRADHNNIIQNALCQAAALAAARSQQETLQP
jgi:hypothetical protein|tara:strand:- start:2085 stop:2282 length:198 start_codon:yes stop_codon:yes gene_type:complete